MEQSTPIVFATTGEEPVLLPAPESPKNYKRTDKVAIVGFAPSSMRLAPFLDESWEIWTLNNIYTAIDIPRWDRWFEIHHNFREYAPFHDARIDVHSLVSGDSRPVVKSIDHVEWLKSQPVGNPIYFIEHQQDIPASVPYPLEELKAWCDHHKFRQYFTNSISYMIALAIAENYKTIGIWGVDMAASGEYEKERPSVEYWMGIMQGLGIEMVLPKETELLKAHFYGWEKDSEFATKMRTRMAELLNNHNSAVAQRDQADRSAWYMKGASDDCQYVLNNWANGA